MGTPFFPITISHMTSRPWFRLSVVVLVFVGLGVLLRLGGSGDAGFGAGAERPAPRDSILHLELEGVIMNGKRFLEHVKKYQDDSNVKAVVITIDSPGGAVGPSQEINTALNRWRKEKKIPVVCVSSGLVASGAYYSAVACDKLIVAPGALVGSIGVIMEFANLERLYDWAKIQRYSITSGKFKDTGAEYRAMREDERKLFQDLINDVYQQFKAAVADGRPNLRKDVLDEYADGRVFTGAKAVELGFADETGNFDDAVKAAADMAGLGEDPNVFKPARPKKSIFDWGQEGEDPVNSMKKAALEVLQLDLANRPLYLMPGTWGREE